MNDEMLYMDIPLPSDEFAPPAPESEVYQAKEISLAPKPQKERLTIERLESEIRRLGYVVRYNILRKRTEVVHYSGQTRKKRIVPLDSFISEIHSAISGSYTNSGFPTLERYTDQIAARSEFNPVIERLERVKWDGKSRISEIYAALHIAEEDWLSRHLIYKWLLQCVALLYNQAPLDDESEIQPFGPEGVLTLQGEQGAGKTSFFRKLGMRWFEEGARLDDFDKDLRRRAITAWITELGEVESTFRKSSVEALKSFITQSVDEFRLPYGRADIRGARLTSMCATCNGTGFLADDTGNRRWFIVPITGAIDRTIIDALDVEQLWTEIFAKVKPMSQAEKAACFRLTVKEREALEERNSGFRKPATAQEDIQMILDEAEDNPCYRYCEMTPLDWQAEFKVLQSYKPFQIGKALKAIGLVERRTKNRRLYVLPVQKATVVPETLHLVK